MTLLKLHPVLLLPPRSSLNEVRSPSRKPQIPSVMSFMRRQQAPLVYREQALVGFNEGVPLPRWDSVSPIQSGGGGRTSARTQILYWQKKNLRRTSELHSSSCQAPGSENSLICSPLDQISRLNHFSNTQPSSAVVFFSFSNFYIYSTFTLQGIPHKNKYLFIFCFYYQKML